MEQMNLLEGLLSEEEVAERLGTGPQWLAGQRRAGKGPKYMKIGNRVMYDVNDVNDWLQAQRRNPGPTKRGAPRKKESTDE